MLGVQSSSSCHAVAAHLESLGHFALALQLVATGEEANAALEKLLATASCWASAAALGQHVSVQLASESCEGVVFMLRALHCPGQLLSLGRIAPLSCAFLALASTVQAFQEIENLPAPSQEVTVAGLQSAVGEKLNGLRGIIMRFHAESGRFIVCFSQDDPPSEWKKIRAQNLVPDADSVAASELATEGARECGRACLEAVADIFDDLLQEFHAKGSEGNLDGPTLFLHGQLATAMWEALICCLGHGGKDLTGGALLELCGNDVDVCSLLARHLFTAHLGISFLGGLLMPPEVETKAVQRLRVLQESFVRSYCSLFHPTALWLEQPGEQPIADLQERLDAHIMQLATSCVQLGLLSIFLDVADFHLEWAISHIQGGPPPFAIPVMFSRLICTILSSCRNPSRREAPAVRRHILMMAPGVLTMCHTFGQFIVLLMRAQGCDSGDLLLATQAVLDVIVALVANGLWEMGRQVPALTQIVLDEFRECPAIVSDPAVLARLVLILLSGEQDAALTELYRGLDENQQAVFWQHVKIRAKLRGVEADELVWQVAGFLHQASPVLPAEVSMPAAAEMENLVDRCLAQLPMSLLITQEAPSTSGSVAAIAAVEEAVMAAQPAEARPAILSALDLPKLPGQLPREPLQQQEAPKKQRLNRAALLKVRGVDLCSAPQELRCAIDGRLLGSPVVSPYGHVFEKETLETWMATCGSVCPVTGQPLRLEECQEDRATERKVLDWVKAAKAEQRGRNRAQRAQPEGTDGAVIH